MVWTATGRIPRERARDAIVATLAPAPLTALELRPSLDAEAEIESCEQRALVDELLEALDPGERAVVRLRFAGDLSQSEIAQRLGTSQSTVSRILTAALAKLRDSLEPELVSKRSVSGREAGPPISGVRHRR